MEALHDVVKSGKARAIGASAMYGYQFHNLQIIARENGWTPFVSMQNHYNLLYREDERELIPLCKQMGVSLTPYSPLAAGRLARANWSADTLRSQTDKTARGKYDGTQQQDAAIAQKVSELAQGYGVSMSQIALAWLFKKGVTAPIIGATRETHFDDAAAALNVRLTDEDTASLEALYQPHRIVGAL